MAHSARLTPAQANGILEYYKSRVEGSVQADTEARHQSQIDAANQLKAEWGSNYDRRVELAQGLANELSDTQAITRIVLEDGTNLGDHPEFIKAFAKFAEFRHSVTSEDTVSESPQVAHMTRQTAQAEIDSIMRGPDYTNRKDPVARDRAVQKVQELMGIVHG
jgi:hypothetical protein